MTASTIDIYDKMFTAYPDLLSIQEIQTMLGISRHLAYWLIREKRIYGFKLGKNYKIPKMSVIDYVLSQKNNVGIECI